MNFLEKNLEEIIFLTPNEFLIDRGLFLFGKKLRQLRIGNYGIADIVSYYRSNGEIFINVFELKKDKIDVYSFLQAINYVKGIRTYLKKRGFSHNVFFNIILIGKEIDTESSFCFLPEFFQNIKLITYNYKFDGIEFKENIGYRRTIDGF